MYRTHYCNDIRESHIGQTVQLAGWVDTIRDHGGVIFVDIRDYTGITQTVVHDESLLANVNKETVISVTGVVSKRDEDTVNEKLDTGRVEMLPFDIHNSKQTREDIRLKYRYLDLRNPEIRDNIVLRSKVISHMRKKMEEKGFLEIQTPILTASSPEGARDFLVPSRKHKGKFYALPQAPQQFKQLLMVSSFDKYFQIAPCFRDEDARQDRSPGEFYQLDYEMAFATQDDVMKVCEEVISDTFHSFSDKKVTEAPFPRITYADAMMKYGSDKPDLRNPLVICDLTEFFRHVDFPLFKNKPVRGIVADCAGQSRSFFEHSLQFAMSIGMKGLGYITRNQDALKGPIEKFLSPEQKKEIVELTGLDDGKTLFFICDNKTVVDRYAGQIRNWLGENLNIVDRDAFAFCFVVDFPMYEHDESTGKIIFWPISMTWSATGSNWHRAPCETTALKS